MDRTYESHIPPNLPCPDPEGCKHFKAQIALQDENARLKALLEHSKTQLEYDELQAENAKLKKALKRYGHHDSPCAALIDDDICPCFCGFEQALKDKDNG